MGIVTRLPRSCLRRRIRPPVRRRSPPRSGGGGRSAVAGPRHARQNMPRRSNGLRLVSASHNGAVPPIRPIATAATAAAFAPLRSATTMPRAPSAARRRQSAGPNASPAAGHDHHTIPDLSQSSSPGRAPAGRRAQRLTAGPPGARRPRPPRWSPHGPHRPRRSPSSCTCRRTASARPGRRACRPAPRARSS
jgi:hypothetical protein